MLSRGMVEQSESFWAEASRRLAKVQEQEQRLHQSVASLQRQEERHPSNEWVGTQLDQTRQELRAIEERRHEFSFHRQATHWTHVGETG